jgi:hypothetical protein
VSPGNFQSGALLTFDLSLGNAGKIIQLYMFTQGDTAASSVGLPTVKDVYGGKAIIDTLLTNYANPNPSDRYLLSLYDVNSGSGHRVTGMKSAPNLSPLRKMLIAIAVQKNIWKLYLPPFPKLTDYVVASRTLAKQSPI